MTTEATRPESGLQVQDDETRRALEFWRASQDVERKRDLVTIADPLLKLDMISDVSMFGSDLQRWMVRVPVYPKHQYLIRGKGVKVTGGWRNEYSAAVRAEGYDWLNRVAGIQFYTPPTVVDREGREVLNPVHAPNYLLHAEVAIWYSETGQMIVEPEVVEIDLLRAWQAERLKRFQKLVKPKKGSSAAKLAEDEGPEEEGYDLGTVEPAAAGPAGELLIRDPESGAPRLGVQGELLFRLPDHLEAEAGERLIQLQNFGLRMAKTIARRRLLMRLLAIRTLWIREFGEKPALETQFVWVTGWRDNLSPDQRLAKAQEEAKVVFGKSIEVKVRPVDPDELGSVAEEPTEAEFTEPEPEAPPTAAPTEQGDVAPVVEKVAAGIIPGVTVGMPGEKLKAAICGARDQIGPHPCTRAPGHELTGPRVHESEDGVWPAAQP